MEPSMSNYSWILLSEKSNTPFQYQNPRKTAWDKFNKIATKTLKVNSFMNKISSSQKLEIKMLEKILTTSFNRSTLLTVLKTKKLPPWWNGDLKTLRIQFRKAFNESYMTKI